MNLAIQHRFEDVLCRIITFLLHPLLHEVNSELEIKVFFFQSCDLLQVIETFPQINSAEKTFYIAQVLKSKINIINCILKNKI